VAHLSAGTPEFAHHDNHPAAPIAAHDEVASAASAPATNPVRFTRACLLTVLMCWLLVVFDGYDLIVYGTVQTTLIETTGWGLTKATAGTVGSVAFAGMLVGAILAGRLSDSLGRKRAVLGCAVVFSVFTIACAFAPNAPRPASVYTVRHRSGRYHRSRSGLWGGSSTGSVTARRW
jgi:MFS transporter, AAHS family, benzoate transport protein